MGKQENRALYRNLKALYIFTPWVLMLYNITLIGSDSLEKHQNEG